VYICNTDVVQKQLKKVSMKKKRLVLYGEKTVLLKTRRVPESKKDELEKMIDDFLMKCVKPGYVESENYLIDEAGVFPFKKENEKDHWKEKKEAKPRKKIEPQVVEECIQTDEDLQYDKDYAEYEKEGYEKLTTFPLGAEKIKMSFGYPIFYDGKNFYTKYVDDKKSVVIVKFKKEQHVDFYILDELPRKK
jgi:hypothetical protein